MPLPFLALAPISPRPVDIYYQAQTVPCFTTTPNCVDCYEGDPFILQPAWDSLNDQTAMTPIPIYGSLGFNAYARE